MKIARQYNNKAISTSQDQVEIRKLQNSNNDINRLLALIGDSKAVGGGSSLSPKAQEWLKKQGM